jgi:dephospho-CoA kinase
MGRCSEDERMKIALTGGIGSGKSTVARLLEARGAVVVDADAIARAIVEPGEPALAEIREAFGPDVIDSSGRLDRSALAGIVFADADSLARLNAITHPRVAARSAELLAAAPNGALLVYDMPLLVEQGPEALLGWDAIVVVDASDGVRLERLRARGMGADDARRRMDAQASREDRLAVATVILDNSGDVAALEEQVGHLWEDLRRQRT